ncbi:MAG TPA: MG2 domain-containing protein, partial [Thermoanaerobaculia bacterium]|nr:MG2 domain-containing protein [Thermoanaerobaculia bacterium]
MMRSTARLRTLGLALLLAVCAGLGGLAGKSAPAPPAAAPAASPVPPPRVNPPKPFPAAGPEWKEVDRLVDEQKMQAALDAATKLREAAQKRGDTANWARGLIREVQLRMSLHGYETAVRFLREQPWPQEPFAQALLQLFYAQALTVYQQGYNWEIARREEVVSTAVPDLKLWTREQIYLEAQKAFLAAWRHRVEWGTAPVDVAKEFIAPNDYPPGVRGTLRDAVSYLFAQLLADSSFWEPAQSNDLYRLPLDELIDGRVGAADAVVADAAQHPLVKLAAVLGDLEAWHREGARAEAAFEARRQRLAHLHDQLTLADDQQRLRTALEAALQALGDRHPWWSMGMATLADWVRAGSERQALVEARKIALAGAAKHPDSVGGRICRRTVAEIEAPDYSLTAMVSDSPDRRSLQVTHRNLGKLYLRAYVVDLDERLRTSDDQNLLPAWREVEQLLASGHLAAHWSVDLPATLDYRDHRTFVTPPLTGPAIYVVVASTRPDFAQPHNRRAAVDMAVGDLVLLSRPTGDGYAVRVLSGASGRPVAGAAVELWRFDWNQGHHREQRLTTGTEGDARLRWSDDSSPHFLLARQGKDVAFDREYLYPSRETPEQERTAALLYTDRSVYRPGQEVQWKAVAYQGRDARFHTYVGQGMTVELVDANGQVVASQAVTTNRFGSAAGAFTVPPGKLLGRWALRSSLGGSAAVQIEEYKRPTFEVTLKDPTEALRLNRPARLPGEARYYFGLPVTAGAVRWQVARQPVYPDWWWWWFGGGQTQPQVIAAGNAEVDAEGAFHVPFTPAADEREASTSGMSYRYLVTADVTDEGG